MLFNKSTAPGQSQFFLPAATPQLKVCVFSAFAGNTFDLSLALAGTLTDKYLLIFYKGDIDSSAATIAELSQNLQNGTSIFWVDSFSGVRLSDQNSIIITNYNQVAPGNIGVNLGISKYGSAYLDNGDTAATITYDQVNFQIKVTAVSSAFTCSFNRGYSSAASFIIPLSTNSQEIGGHSYQQTNNLGALCFQFQKSGNNALPQPVSTFLLPVTGAALKAVIYTYFDQDSYESSVQTFASIKPFQQISSDQDPLYSNYIETVNAGQLLTNFLDEKANKYAVSAIGAVNNTLVSRLMPVIYPSSTDYYFIPQQGQQLSLLRGDSQGYCLIGNSGTEALQLLKFMFKESTLLLINPNGDDFSPTNDYLIPNGTTNSKTAFLTVTNSNFYLDANKSALFPNNGIASPYSFIQKAAIKQNIDLPIIPTMAFKDNPSLSLCEDVVKKARLKWILNNTSTTASVASGSYITPQGFLKKSNNYDFILNGSSVKGSLRKPKIAGLTDPATFQFTITDNGGNLDTSLRKDQVFLVLTPQLFYDYVKKNTTAQVNVLFNVNNSATVQFIINLAATYNASGGSACSHNNSIIVIKFYKDSFKNLIADPTKWSNHGDILADKNELALIKQSLQVNTQNITDDYFKNSVLIDPNWNGVCVLNVPIANSNDIPTIFTGLGANQNLFSNTLPPNPPPPPPALILQTGLAFQYVAFPINKTKSNSQNSEVHIKATSFNGYIDYSPFENDTDYKSIYNFFTDNFAASSNSGFVLSKLQVQFRNSAISSFDSYAFLQVPQLFEDKLNFGPVILANPDELPARTLTCPNLILINGKYQKDSSGKDSVEFAFIGDLKVNFPNNPILTDILILKVGFITADGGSQNFRFEIDAQADFAPSVSGFGNLFSFDSITFQNIGLSFNINNIFSSSNLSRFAGFDLSRFAVLPKISFSGNGFLSSFPVSFNCFKGFKFNIISTSGGGVDFQFPDGDFDFFKLPAFKAPSLNIGATGHLFSMIFDINLGTLGQLGGLQGLGAQLLIGWSFNGGFGLALKFNGPSINGLHLDLFGALGLDIDQLDICSQNGQFIIKLLKVQLHIFGLDLPSDDANFSAIIFAEKGQKTAWMASYLDEDQNLTLGIGQRMGLTGLETVNSVGTAIGQVKSLFKPVDNPCQSLPTANYQPNNNWLIASEKLLPSSWPIDFSFIFNDPTLYGVHLGVAGFTLEILYKKLAENLGVYSADIQLPDSLRHYDTGGATFQLPNIGIQIFTNGDWKSDIGFPATSNDWSRSGFIQLRTAPPFVGWFGFYLAKSKSVALTLFKDYLPDTSSYNILQFGFAMRVGLGAYISGGIFYAGASISVYGIMEGAAAFKQGQGALTQFFPTDFAVQGRMGAIAEIVGYVDFGILKAGIYISLSAEFGFLLIYLGESVPGHPQGLQPAKVYLEGDVRVEITIKIGCIHIHLRFGAHLRLEYTIGGGSRSSSLRHPSLAKFLSGNHLIGARVTCPQINITNIKNIPVIYIPAYTSSGEFGEPISLVHSFKIPFFGNTVDVNGDIQFTQTNILKDLIIKPFFQDLLTELQAKAPGTPFSYTALKDVLYNADFLVSNYKPTFIEGLNATDYNTVKSILTQPNLGFGFQQGELKPATGTVNDAISTSYVDSLMIIPCPIASSIQIVDVNYNGNNPVYQANNGFSLTLQELANNPDGTTPVITQIGQISSFSQADVTWMLDFFNSYKVQFDTQKSSQVRKLLDPANPDLRQTVVIPEFFTLIGLLTLEAFYNNPKIAKTKNGPIADPVITSIDANGIFNYTYQGANLQWNPNDDLQNIVGQINYFFNTGLRLPVKNGQNTTKAIMDLLGQCTPIHVPDAATRNAANVKVLIDAKDITQEVFATQADVRLMWKFMDGFNDQTFNLNNLKTEFAGDGTVNPIKINSPYKLVPVKLHVPNSKLNFTHNNGTQTVNSRFFALPPKLQSEGKNLERFTYEVNYANYKQQTNGEDNIEFSSNPPSQSINTLQGYSKCLNIEVKVKTRNNQVLEIVNVDIADLNLIDLLNADNFPVSAISIYYKPDVTATASNPTPPVNLENYTSNYFSILKTNLSPRTMPPTINVGAMLALAKTTKPATIYWEESDADTKNFTRLVWESLTTNDGGYFLILDNIPINSGLADPGSEHTVILSFQSQAAQVPSYFNYFTLDDNQTANIFDALDNNDHYLFLDRITNTSGIRIVEYYPSIPVHTVNFGLTRDTSKTVPVITTNTYAETNYGKYLPLEFSLTGSGANPFSLSADQVLPIMPTSDTDPAKQTLMYYSQIAPLLNVQQGNITRYCAIGQQFTINTNLRDIFGLRVNNNPSFIASTTYKHLYNDKVIPASAWPLFNFGYWGTTVAQGSLSLNLQSNVNFLLIFDMAGIPKVNGNYKYDFTPPEKRAVAPDDCSKVIEVFENGLLDKLNTITAQLSDPNATLSVSYYTKEATQKAKDLLLAQANAILAQYYSLKNASTLLSTPVAAVDFPLSIPLSGTFIKQALDINVTYSRPANLLLDTAFAELKDATTNPDTYIWEYQTTAGSVTTIEPATWAVPQAPAKTSGRKPKHHHAEATTDTGADPTSQIALFTAWIEGAKHVTPNVVPNLYTVGLSVDKKTNKKVIYVINKAKLAGITIDPAYLTQDPASHKWNLKPENCYFGILPYANQLWSGQYSPDPTTVAALSFKDVDLDDSLQTILNRIELLLEPAFVKDNFKGNEGLYEKLVGAKKWLANSVLRSKTAWTMGNTPDANRDTGLQDEFGDLLLKDLTDFYSFDGFAYAGINKNGLDLSNHRLTVAIGQQQGYNLVSSKIGYHYLDGNGAQVENNGLYILFDQQADDTLTVDFDIAPSITHIETDIVLHADSNIEESTWIQLVNPISLNNYSINNWPRIYRGFPPKPVITKHAANQKLPIPSAWDIASVGLWNYQLEIQDLDDKTNRPHYEPNDTLSIEIQLTTATARALMADTTDLSGFIAYWASKIIDTANPFVWQTFVNDLTRFSASLKSKKQVPADEVASYTFTLTKVSTGKWTPINNTTLKISVIAGTNPGVLIGPFDIFDATNRVVSVMPVVTAYRNPEIKNQDFLYQTASVSPLTSVMPHISYFAPMPLSKGALFQTDVFAKIIDMPYKVTAKYLINTDSGFPDPSAVLPIIPVQQFECDKGTEMTAADDNFKNFNNGYASYALTIYNNEDDPETNLPVFFAETITKI